VKDSFPLPRIDDLINKLRNAKCMTHLDLRIAYNQVRMSDCRMMVCKMIGAATNLSRPHNERGILSTKNVAYGVWPLQRSCHISQLIMNHLLEAYINNVVIVYLDDTCIYFETLEQHIDPLRLIL